MTSLRERLEINFDRSLRIPIRQDWKLALLPANNDYLTDYFDGFIRYCKLLGQHILTEFYMVPEGSSKAVEAIYNPMITLNEVIVSQVREHGFLLNAIFSSEDLQAIFIMTHDEIGLLIGDEESIQKITNKSVDILNEEFKSYVASWSGSIGENVQILLNVAKDYPGGFVGQETIDVIFA